MSLACPGPSPKGQSMLLLYRNLLLLPDASDLASVPRPPRNPSPPLPFSRSCISDKPSKCMGYFSFRALLPPFAGLLALWSRLRSPLSVIPAFPCSVPSSSLLRLPFLLAYTRALPTAVSMLPSTARSYYGLVGPGFDLSFASSGEGFPYRPFVQLCPSVTAGNPFRLILLSFIGGSDPCPLPVLGLRLGLRS